MLTFTFLGVGSAFAERRAELDADELAISDQAYDLQGQLVRGRADDPMLRFRRTPGT